jgi:nitroreductase
MDILKVMKSRRSIRVFEKRVLPKKIIQECLEAATWAPNPTNQQPWEFIVVTGETLKKVSEIIVENFPQRMKTTNPYADLPKACEERKDETFKKIFSAAKESGIDPSRLFQKSLSFYGAPVAVLFVTYKMRKDLYRLSTAAALQNFLIAAQAKGLGTCWLSTVSICQKDIKELLKISKGKEILDGVALGYPVKDSPLNTFSRTRLPMEEVTTWVGF